jgi:hypothetical protein
VVDSLNHTRFYYHAHASSRFPAAEHGHFHLFSYGSQPGDFVHLAALSLDNRGQPLRWFTTNQWVTGERWRAAPQMLDLLSGFALQAKGRMAPLARWLTAMVHLFIPQLKHLLLQRDAALASRQAQTRQSWSALCEDRQLDVLSEYPIDLGAHILKIHNAAAGQP